MHGTIAVDFDGTLATYDTWQGPTHTGDPIAPMVERVKAWLREGRVVKIFTARVDALGTVQPNDIIPMRYDVRGQECAAAARAIQEWCAKHIGQVLTITCIKDRTIEAIYDDRAFQVEKNTGRIVGQ